MKQLDHKVIVLTGGSEGIGYECAKAYAAEGAKLVILAIGEKQLAKVMAELGPEHLGVCCDVRNEEQVSLAMQKAIAQFGKIDAIHNNAGIASPSKTLDETTEDEWNDLMDVNLKSIYYTVKYGIKALKETRGCILNTSSLVGEIGQELHAAYTATKGAVNALTKSMALDYAKFHVRVNAVSPAGVWTPTLQKWTEEQPSTAFINEYLNNIHPLGYCPQGDVIADACVFLLSDKARFITGCILPISGGAELGYRSVLPVAEPVGNEVN
ncbi:SDR family NAD(P)-dependent oxidoreductase [Flavisolibacter tropicus]|uniref:Short-chain dehydrogenase n=1 Tax=Flavisolibacter tropicus TaxID=1492898 RepID=A0A172TWN4_9BACT|nr:SDR family oxidoreductase [Flavisolibacter tropicus]ANE51392.1 short-chain dehydrogenase [Flavisolibacter tropicus]